MSICLVCADPTADAAARRGFLGRLREARVLRWMAVLALMCTLGLYVVKFSHEHKTEVGKLHCPVCQAVANGLLNVFVSGIGSPSFCRTPYFVVLSEIRPFFPERPISPHPPSRAPPRA